MNTSYVEISSYDSRELQRLAIDSADDQLAFGTSNGAIERALREAFRLGFTAVSRGESNEPHPEWVSK